MEGWGELMSERKCNDWHTDDGGAPGITEEKTTNISYIVFSCASSCTYSQTIDSHVISVVRPNFKLQKKMVGGGRVLEENREWGDCKHDGNLTLFTKS